MHGFRLMAIFLLSELLLGACSTDIRHQRSLFGPDPGPCIEKLVAGPGDDSYRVTPVVPIRVNPLYSNKAVYFAFDSYIVQDSFEPQIRAHAEYLAANPAAMIRLEGNADERGSHEYNLALGQKRADALRNILVVLGVPNSRMEAISFGKEKPIATGSDEASFAKNRRADVFYTHGSPPYAVSAAATTSGDERALETHTVSVCPPVPDAGMECTSSSECWSHSCLGDKQVTHQSGNLTVGVCAKREFWKGCRAIVENGVALTLCRD